MKQIKLCNPINKDTIQRYALFVIGLFFSALGVAITKKGELGVSPISSAANVMSIRFPQLSLGYWLIIWNCVLILDNFSCYEKNSSGFSFCKSLFPFYSAGLRISAYGWFLSLHLQIIQQN